MTRGRRRGRRFPRRLAAKRCRRCSSWRRLFGKRRRQRLGRMWLLAVALGSEGSSLGEVADDGAEECLEGLLHVLPAASRALVEHKSILCCPRLGLFQLHLSVFAVRLVGEDDSLHFVGAVLVSLLRPQLQRCERVSVSHVEHQDRPLCVAIELVSNFKIFLPSGQIPKIHLYLLVVNYNGFDAEVHTDCGNVLLHKLFFAVSLDQARFSACRISHADDFDPDHISFRWLWH
mmetsp:Transcript_23058/g.46653  ORF Transcript_23058/g.46653 Transcript_23058/m.46653 type:complete len:232 (-) Transcript_23058:56-751(-)